MSLKLWLPLNGHLKNKGCAPEEVTTVGSVIATTGGKFGKCYTINNGNIIVPATLVQEEFGTECSVAMWVYFNSFGNSFDTLIQIGLGNPSYANYMFGILRNNTSNNFIFVTGNGTTTTTNNCVTETTFTTGKWYHIAATLQGKKMTLYVNGNKENEYTTSYVPDFTTVTHISIGRGTNNSTYPVNGKFNDIRIYNHCLSAKEVKEISKALLLHYPLNQADKSRNLLADSYWKYERIGTRPSSGYFDFAIAGGVCTPAVNSTYTLSFLAKTDETKGNLVLHLYNNNPGRQCIQSINSQGVIGTRGDGYSKIILSKTYEYYWVKWKFDAGTPELNKTLLFRLSSGDGENNGKVYIKNVKFELGDNPSPSWTSNTDEGLKEYDCSGFENNAITTVTNRPVASFDSPRYNECYTFDGSSHHLESEKEPTDMFPTDQITVNVWGKAKNWSNSTFRMISCTEDGGFDFEHSNNYPRFPIYVGGSYGIAQSSVTGASLGEGWHMFTGTYDGATIKFYIDGIERGSAAKTGTIFYRASFKLQIGRECPNGLNFNGDISDVRIYGTALDEESIKELYNTSFIIANTGATLAYEYNELS